VIHRAVELRMRMQDHRDRRVLLFGRMIAAFKAASRAGENHFRHHFSLDKEINRLRARFIWLSADETPQEKVVIRRRLGGGARTER